MARARVTKQYRIDRLEEKVAALNAVNEAQANYIQGMLAAIDKMQGSDDKLNITELVKIAWQQDAQGAE